MIQFNLLPDIKVQYLRTRRIKRVVILIAALVTGVSLTVMIVLFSIVHFLQKQHIDNLSGDIAATTKAIQDIPDLDKMLTVQNQLNNIAQLHGNKPVASRMIDYLGQITPADLTIANLEVNFEETTMSFTGAASSLANVNKFVDTLKFTRYEAGEDGGNAFSNVVLASFGRDDRGASYQVNLVYDPVIFSDAAQIKLVVPNITTTRSNTLFSPLSNQDEDKEGVIPEGGLPQ